VNSITLATGFVADVKSRDFPEANMTEPASTIYLSDTSDRALFDRIADELRQALDGTWVVQASGLDQRYWDLEAEGQVITLHLEHYLGIMLLVDDADPDWVASARFQALVQQLQAVELPAVAPLIAPSPTSQVPVKKRFWHWR
jgi:hypothetical protein